MYNAAVVVITPEVGRLAPYYIFGQKNLVANNCPKIAQNGALLNKNFFPEKFFVKYSEYFDKMLSQLRPHEGEFLGDFSIM
jgi:hypothetical protein